MNLTEAKYNTIARKNKLFNPIDYNKSSNPFITEYETEYSKKREEAKKAVHEEIKARYNEV